MAFYEPLVRVDATGSLLGMQAPDSAIMESRIEGLRSQIESGGVSPIQTDTAATAGSPDLTITGQLTDSEIADGYGVFTLTGGVTYSFAERGAGPDPLVDSYLLLANLDSGQFVAQDDDGGLGRSSMLTFTPETRLIRAPTIASTCGFRTRRPTSAARSPQPLRLGPERLMATSRLPAIATCTRST